MAASPTPQAELLSRLSVRLRSFRRRAKLTQESLAEAAGVQPETISRLENGHQLPSMDVLVRLTGVLECSFGELLDEPQGLAVRPQLADLVEGLNALSTESIDTLAAFVRTLPGS